MVASGSRTAASGDDRGAGGVSVPPEGVGGPSRRRRAIALIDKWLVDNSGYDEQTWPVIREAIRTNGWMADVRAWATSHPQVDHVVDDSRESVYGGRA